MNKKLAPIDPSSKNRTTLPNATGTTGNNKVAAKDQAKAGQDKDKKEKEKNFEKELSSEEKLALIEIKPIEKKALDKAFRRLCRATNERDYNNDSFTDDRRDEAELEKQKKGLKPEDNQIKGYFTAEDVGKVLAELRHNASKPEIELMIWVLYYPFLTLIVQEVDENLDKRVDRDEFELMFRRCIEDETGLEPKSLFNLVQFLMYAKEDSIEITEEDTLELIYVRKNSIKGLEDALKIIFG